MFSGVTWVLFLAGPMVAGAYLLSSLIRTWTINRGSNRGSSRDDPDSNRDDQDEATDGSTGIVPLSTVVEAATVAAISLAALVLMRSQAPGRTTFQNASALGFLSSQVLTVWSSMALWAGLAAVVGHATPITRRFRHGTSGAPGALALLILFVPLTALAAAGAWFATLSITREIRPALALSYASVVVAEWVFGVINPSTPWGLVHGPETTLFMAVMAGALLARWAAGDIGDVG